MIKKNSPIITQVEILARAIRSIDEEIRDLNEKASVMPNEIAKQWRDAQGNRCGPSVRH